MTELNNLPFFTTNELVTSKNILDTSVKQYAKRKIDDGSLLGLKKGMYVSREYVSGLMPNDLNLYKEFIATVIKQPSYISLEYALGIYQILPEMVASITCVTLSRPYSLNNYFGNYFYRSIKKDLFGGFEIKYFKNSNYYFASKSKALFDHLYYKLPTIPVGKSTNLVEELRLDLTSMKKEDWENLSFWSKKLGSDKFSNLVLNLKGNAYNN